MFSGSATGKLELQSLLLWVHLGAGIFQSYCADMGMLPGVLPLQDREPLGGQSVLHPSNDLCIQ